MPNLRVQVPHSLARPEARQRLERFLELLQESYGNQVSDLDQAWEDNTLRFRFKSYGFRLAGSIAVTDDELDVQSDLPFAAIVFRHKIESAIRQQLTRLMAN